MGTDDRDVADRERVLGADGGLMDPELSRRPPEVELENQKAVAELSRLRSDVEPKGGRSLTEPQGWRAGA